MKWAYVFRDEEDQRHRLLSEFLNQNQMPNEFESLRMSLDSVCEELNGSLKKFDFLRFDFSFSDVLMKSFEYKKSDIETLNSVDSIVFDGQKRWLNNSYYFGIQKSIILQKMTFETDKKALIIGSNSYSRLICAILIKLGFKEINLSSLYEEQAKDLISSLNSHFFGVKFNFVSQDELIMLPGNNSLLVNTLNFSEVSELLHHELYYFNFLNPTGLVWDLKLEINFNENALVEEATKVGVKTLDNVQAIIEADKVWVNWILDQNLNTFKFKEFLRKNI